jgi:hypothetical protein
MGQDTAGGAVYLGSEQAVCEDFGYGHLARGVSTSAEMTSVRG